MNNGKKPPIHQLNGCDGLPRSIMNKLVIMSNYPLISVLFTRHLLAILVFH